MPEIPTALGQPPVLEGKHTANLQEPGVISRLNACPSYFLNCSEILHRFWHDDQSLISEGSSAVSGSLQTQHTRSCAAPLSRLRIYHHSFFFIPCGYLGHKLQPFHLIGSSHLQLLAVPAGGFPSLSCWALCLRAVWLAWEPWVREGQFSAL